MAVPVVEITLEMREGDGIFWIKNVGKRELFGVVVITIDMSRKLNAGQAVEDDGCCCFCRKGREERDKNHKQDEGSNGHRKFCYSLPMKGISRNHALQ